MVVSRPQILVSKIDLVGKVNVKEGTVQVQEVLYPPNAKQPAKGDEISVTNFDEVQPPLPEHSPPRIMPAAPPHG